MYIKHSKLYINYTPKLPVIRCMHDFNLKYNSRSTIVFTQKFPWLKYPLYNNFIRIESINLGSRISTLDWFVVFLNNQTPCLFFKS